jgi:hypothetical protein
MTERFIKLSAKTNKAEIVSIPAVPDKELDSSFNEFIHRELDCDIYEAVDVGGTFRNIMMLVDERGKLRHCYANMIAWMIYNGIDYRDPIVGDVMFVGLHRVGELQELDFCGLTNEQIENIMEHIGRFKKAFKLEET